MAAILTAYDAILREVWKEPILEWLFVEVWGQKGLGGSLGQ